MQTPEIVLNRIDQLTEGLSPAVQKAGGAQFALLLSMIAESQAQAYRLTVAAASEAEQRDTPQRLDLYTPELVGRLNESLKNGSMGDVYLLLSWLETAPLRGRALPSEASETAVSLPQAALMAKKYSVLDEINESTYRIAA